MVVLSESSANILQHYGSEKTKIHVIRQTSLPKEEELRKKETIEQGSILYVGWLQHRKGLHVIIKAMPKILRSVPEAKLYIIGEVTEEDKQYLNELEHLIKREGLENRVLFLGKKPYEEVKEFLRKSQVVVIPEQWENMSPVILVEAMAFAKPVVASRIGGIPEFIDDNRNGLLVEPHNLSDFTKKVVLLLKNGAYAAKIGETASKDIIKLCDQKQSLKKLLDLYNSF